MQPGETIKLRPYTSFNTGKHPILHKLWIPPNFAEAKILRRHYPRVIQMYKFAFNEDKKSRSF